MLYNVYLTLQNDYLLGKEKKKYLNRKLIVHNNQIKEINICKTPNSVLLGGKQNGTVFGGEHGIWGPVLGFFTVYCIYIYNI